MWFNVDKRASIDVVNVDRHASIDVVNVDKHASIDVVNVHNTFLCGVCMFSLCSQGISSTKNPNRKTCKKNRTLLSVPDRDGRFTWSPGAEKLPTAPGGSWRRDGP